MLEKQKNTQRYKSYKKIEIEYLGEIPTGWTTIKAKYAGNIYNGDSLNEQQKGKYGSTVIYSRPYISSKDICASSSAVNYKSGIRIPTHETKYKVAPRASILFCIEGGSAGKKIAFTDQEVCFVNKLACFRVNDAFDSRYIFYSLKSYPFQNQFNRSMTGLIGGVSISSINNFVLAIPPVKEQTAIANYLDRKTAQIDQVVKIKEKQIALLRERKQILVRNAVTRGLNPDTSLRDSNIKWVGDIPVHWMIKRFKYLFTQSRLEPRKSDGVVTSYRDGQVTLRSNRRLEGYTEAILEQGYQGVRVGQLVLNSMDAFEGAIGVSDSDGKCTPEYVVCDPVSEEYKPKYYAYLLREMALTKYIRVICSAVRQRAIRIRFNNIAKQFMIVPPKNEQSAIISYIENESAKIDKGINLLQRQIDRINEYKDTLINSAVTGKIKAS